MKLNIITPTCHQELTQSQLRYLYSLIVSGYKDIDIKTMCLMRFAKADISATQPGVYLIKIDGTEGVNISSEQIAEVLHYMDWVVNIPNYPVCLTSVGGKTRLYDPMMSGLTFSAYMEIENLYQGYLHAKSEKLLDRISIILYGAPANGAAERYSVLVWFASLKKYLANMFKFLFHAAPVSQTEQEDLSVVHDRLLRNMNIQIRALTKGDITKEKDILQTDYMSALRELDAQAEEYEEIKKQTSK